MLKLCEMNTVELGITEAKNDSLFLSHFPRRMGWRQPYIFPEMGKIQSQSFPYFLEYQS